VISRYLPLQVVLVFLGIAAVRRDVRRYRAASGDDSKAVRIRRIGRERLVYALVFVACFVLAVSSLFVWEWPSWVGYAFGAIAAVALVGGRWRTLHLEAANSSEMGDGPEG